MTRRMRLVGFNMVSPSAHHHGMWLHPETQNDLLNPERYEKFARTMEEGFFDGIFFADSVALFGGGDPNSVELSKGVQVGLLDPLALIAIMARVTKHIGLGATISTSFLPPYQLARSLATLDIISGGRIAWNVVTSSSQAEARNFGMDDLLPRDERYDRADEVLEACSALWNSWEDGAFQMDKRTGVAIDPTKVHRVDFNGKYVSTAGPLNVPRSPQGRPVIMQAGASERGREFAAKWAEIIFTFQHDVDDMVAFYKDIKSRMAKYGRHPDECAILISADPIVGETTAIAEQKRDYVNGLIDADLSIAHISSHLGRDFSTYALDTPVEEIFGPLDRHGSAGVLSVILQASREKNWTLGEMARHYSASQMCPQIVGTAEEVAARQREFFDAGGCDGFIITPTEYPGTFETYVRSVIPILQEQGLVRTAYKGGTFRENLLD